MTRRVLLAMPGNAAFGDALAQRLGIGQIALDWRRFPDGESYVRLAGEVAGAEVIVVCTLANPDPQILSLIFAARTARELGATRIVLVAPYLAYMRQDKRFQPGEAVTSVYFADLLSQDFDALVTADPHLHRHRSLSEIYTIPTRVVQSAPALAAWIAANVPDALLIGPDEESRQWVAAVAAAAGAPAVVLHKDRSGDREVRITLPDLGPWQGRTPVLVDDIVSSGETLLEAARQLAAAGFHPPVCVAVHPVLAPDAFARLLPHVAGFVSTDSIPHASNGIRLVDLFAAVLEAGV